jgi:hypothetical protein
MNKIALTAAAFLVATSAAFAGSDNYGSNNANQPAASVANVDHSFTGSINKSDTAKSDTAQNGSKFVRTPGQGIWGH